ncbi:hypothetical protein [Enterococcus gallinarum]|uniref:Uncharacterized protein n=1 Tax=Enterococcus gallinarum TaxID=1353 RepID=A0ABD4ZTB6_ENTGA|nr:hypothetical protein [Enterococcus gallinarum]MDL4874978.1 hypothetical protein [Enterococcus gallinarum]MDL4880750.1 hypothetical protein [Enterococcus gallinarum]MDL4884298.1 hypothetical protein [Enterococcus gallinarum]MDL4893027.1 hypothetical protein [Enterococcus gallinarum]MDL4920560.1 hypothetical protein [Enterococcus gallinarum]
MKWILKKSLRNISLNSFRFDLSRKLDSKLEDNKIKEILDPEQKIDIKNKMRNGGEIFLTAPDRDRVITISDNFLTSVKIPKVKFTNLVNLKNVPKSTIKTLEKIINDISYICQNNSAVSFSQTNTGTLRTVLKAYGLDEPLDETNETIFKVEGISFYEQGQKENPFRIYMKIDGFNEKRTNYRLLFCDIYHLCLISGHKGLNADQVRNRTYLMYCYTCKNHLRELLEI